jgi:protease-4
VARDVLKTEDVIDYTQREGLPERVLRKFGASVGEGMARFSMSHSKPALR